MGIIAGIMAGVWEVMSEEDRKDLEAFEKDMTNARARWATSDWDGWERLLGFSLQRYFLNEVNEARDPPQNHKRPGLVYVMETQGGAYKIGWASFNRSRISEIPAKMPYETSVVMTIECDDAPVAERELHEWFRGMRMRGEWFRLDGEALCYLGSIERFENGTFWSIWDPRNALEADALPWIARRKSA
jgi:hypothetical protein